MRKLFASIVIAALAPLQPAVAGHVGDDHAGAEPSAGGAIVGVDDSGWDAEHWKWAPEQVEIAVGETVTWDMTGAKMAHSATAEDGSWDSGYVQEGDKWSRRFETPGQYRYYCYPHPWKKGVVLVR